MFSHFFFFSVSRGHRRRRIRDEERWSVRQSVRCVLLTKKKEVSGYQFETKVLEERNSPHLFVY
jgi:hypothetical protein